MLYWIISTEKLVHIKLPPWAFREAGKATISFIMSVCPTVCPSFRTEQIGAFCFNYVIQHPFQALSTHLMFWSILCYCSCFTISPSFQRGIVSYKVYILIKIKVDDLFGIIYFVDFVHHPVLRNKKLCVSGTRSVPFLKVKSTQRQHLLSWA